MGETAAATWRQQVACSKSDQACGAPLAGLPTHNCGQHGVRGVFMRPARALGTTGSSALWAAALRAAAT